MKKITVFKRVTALLTAAVLCCGMAGASMAAQTISASDLPSELTGVSGGSGQTQTGETKEGENQEKEVTVSVKASIQSCVISLQTVLIIP